MALLTNKKALILGIANNKSIAYGIAEAFAREGATLALTYQNERLKSRIDKCAESLGCTQVIACDVQNDTEVEALFKQLKQDWGQLDILVHSIGFAPANALEGDFTQNTSRDDFLLAHDISSYSLIKLCQHADKVGLFTPTASVITLSYLGAERIIPNYNVMGLAKASLEAGVRYLAGSLGAQGIRVNAISAGPIRTLAASGIKHFRKMLQYAEAFSPLNRNVTTTEVGNAAAFLASDLASGITGQTLYVDAGFNISGLPLRELTSSGETSSKETGE